VYIPLSLLYCHVDVIPAAALAVQAPISERNAGHRAGRAHSIVVQCHFVAWPLGEVHTGHLIILQL
jgi:hypothetical protein